MRLVFSSFFLTSVLTFLFLIPLPSLASATLGDCDPSYSSSGQVNTTEASEVGIFMVGVCQECWDLGDCGLKDILTVVGNIGNYILSIVAGLVFLVYILGGFWWIASHGNTAWVTKGKTYIKNATLGLFIVLFAYAGVATLEMAIKTGEVGGEVVVCDGSDESLGQSCGLNMLCAKSGCISECENNYPGQRTCMDTETYEAIFDSSAECIAGLCPGGETNQCCPWTN